MKYSEDNIKGIILDQELRKIRNYANEIMGTLKESSYEAWEQGLDDFQILKSDVKAIDQFLKKTLDQDESLLLDKTIKGIAAANKNLNRLESTPPPMETPPNYSPADPKELEEELYETELSM